MVNVQGLNVVIDLSHFNAGDQLHRCQECWRRRSYTKRHKALIGLIQLTPVVSSRPRQPDSGGVLIISEPTMMVRPRRNTFFQK